MRDGAPRRDPTTLQREVLPGRNALHSLRSRDRVYVSLGCRFQGDGRRQQTNSLEHAQLYHDPDGRIRLRIEEGRARLETVADRFNPKIRRAMGKTVGFQLACQPLSA